MTVLVVYAGIMDYDYPQAVAAICDLKTVRVLCAGILCGYCSLVLSAGLVIVVAAAEKLLVMLEIRCCCWIFCCCLLLDETCRCCWN